MANDFHTVTDRRLGDTDFAPDSERDPAFSHGYDILLAAPDSLGRRWAKMVQIRMYDAGDTLMDCHDDAVAVALEYLNREAAWGSVWAYSSYRTAREEVAALIAAEADTATPARHAELIRAQSDPRGWAERQRPGRGMAFPTRARGLRVAQLFHLEHTGDPDAPGLHTHLLIAPEVVAATTDRHPRAQAGEFYELDLVTLSSILPAVFVAYLGALDDLTEERLGLRLKPDPDPRWRPTTADEFRSVARGKVDCRPRASMYQLDEVTAATWQVPRYTH